MAQTPIQCMTDWLAGRPADARVAIVVDTDRLVADSGALVKPSIVDEAGRSWSLAVYSGNDLAFRLRFRKIVETDRILIVLTGSPDPDAKPMDASFIADILSRNEAGPPLDLSVPAFFSRLCPQINFPVGELRRYKGALLDRLDSVPAATRKIIERWGKPDDWGRGQVAALVLLAYHPEVTLKEIWADEAEPVDFLLHVIRLLVAYPAFRLRRSVLEEAIAEAARPQVKALLGWLRLPVEELSAFLVLRHFAGMAGLQNPATQLAGIQLFSTDLPIAELDLHAEPLCRRLVDDADLWGSVQQMAESCLSQKRIQRVLELISAGHSTMDGHARFVLDDSTPASVARGCLREMLAAFFKDPTVLSPALTDRLAGHPELQAGVKSKSPEGHQIHAGMKCLAWAGGIERALAETLPKCPHAEALLDGYVAKRIYLLELRLSEAFHSLSRFDDADLLEKGQSYFFGGPDDVAPSPESLKGRLVGRLHEIDRMLAAIVAADPAAFQNSPRGAVNLVKTRLAEAAADAIAGEGDGRVWVLVFDGMRFDTWTEVVQPILSEHFQIEGGACFSVLPSFTQIARTSLLAGALPGQWYGFKGNPISDEATLVGKNLGLTAQELSAKLRFVTEADTMKARTILGHAGDDTAAINVLIYPISDECHDFRGDLAAFNNKIRMEMLGEKSHGVRGILEDLLRRISPKDTVLATSDHGFVELLTMYGRLVTQAQAAKADRTLADDVHWRYTKGFRAGEDADAVQIAVGADQYYVAAGRSWFKREGAKFTARYSHGGLTLPETVVPGFVLHRVTTKTSRVELADLPATGLVVNEDETAFLTFAIRNTGNVQTGYELQVRTNLGDIPISKKGQLAPGDIEFIQCSVVGRYGETASREMDKQTTLTAISIRLQHTGLDGVMRDAIGSPEILPVTIKPKAVKLDTDALKSFDGII